ncbi:MAG: ferrous iron transport protein A [Ruminococcaceae bacterium]|nr:ferrous iron transport protein A [Oscillospiraceae bacterium]
MEPNLLRADQLAPDGGGRVIDVTLSGMLRRRLFDLGVIPGAVIRRRYTAPSGSPIAFEVQGAIVALRKADAHNLIVEEVAQSWTQ